MGKGKMKDLDKAIRSREWQLNDKRMKVEELERLVERIRAEIDQIENGLKQKQQVATRNTGAATGYSNYVLAVFARRDNLRQSLSDLEGEMVLAAEEVATARREFEKLNFMRSRYRARAESTNDHSQQRAIDVVKTDLDRRASGS